MPTPVNPDALNADELNTWSALATILEWLPAALDTQLSRDSGMSHFEFGVLFALSHADGENLRMSELARFANSTLSRTSRAMDRLERRGWVHRTSDPHDGRTTIAMLTPHGRDAKRAAEPGHVDLVRRLVFDALTPTQVRQLDAISRRLAGAMRPDASWRP